MKLLINMISLFQAGPKTVGLAFLEGLLNGYSGSELCLMLPEDRDFRTFIETHGGQLSGNGVSWVFVPYPRDPLRFLRKLYYDHVLTARLARQGGFDRIFMMANFPSLLSSKRQYVLQHNPFYLEESRNLPKEMKGARFSLEKLLFTIGVRKCKRFIVQTDHIKGLLVSLYGVPPENIAVVHMAPLCNGTASSQGKPPFAGHDRTLKLFFPAKLHPHKNHSIAIEAAEFIKTTKRSVRIFVTLSPTEWEQFSPELRKRGLLDTVINLGYINNWEISGYYAAADALFFPTQSESLGFPYLEALTCGLPIITFDFPVAREVCGAAALYFDLADRSSLERVIESLDDREAMAHLREEAVRQGARYGRKWEEISHEMLTFVTGRI
jgi:glycosyltransferase involved in cell wall biosynthesis